MSGGPGRATLVTGSAGFTGGLCSAPQGASAPAAAVNRPEADSPSTEPGAAPGRGRPARPSAC